MKEKNIEYEILQWLNANGIFAWKVNVKGYYDTKKKFWRKTNNIFDLKGQADISAVLPDGHYMALEVKRKGGKKTQEQEHFLHCVKEKGGIGCVVTCIEDVEEELKNHGYILTQ
jgi:hypothetical protein